ncbi:uncharacterized protein ColSpa_07767 [Colletotrichum spaethianum]|uniref:Uncharacterized protein n=1 Tax=Colletotrichum spaethianum TaxID=700344 RepID=A0AA37P8H1_9PEZI|nr:uncharacterized protein ColSpa_07767 [Colletotrichum spaethianum]GKT47586.1 hypothetical protein ColSpa_07767 [Colletotrichum spaethianum]
MSLSMVKRAPNLEADGIVTLERTDPARQVVPFERAAFANGWLTMGLDAVQPVNRSHNHGTSMDGP